MNQVQFPNQMSDIFGIAPGKTETRTVAENQTAMKDPEEDTFIEDFGDIILL